MIVRTFSAQESLYTLIKDPHLRLKKVKIGTPSQSSGLGEKLNGTPIQRYLPIEG